MRRSREDISDAIGTDAFLDIVANLVGILLIFLMVIGVRMEDASKSVQQQKQINVAELPPADLEMPEPLDLPEIEMPDTSAAEMELSRLKSSIRDADTQTQEIKRLMAIQKLDRDNLMLAITKAEIELNKRRDTLDATQQAALQTKLELQTIADNYSETVAQLEAIDKAADETKPEVLEHIATPLAKTVFVREEHFRLSEGRLLYVPLNEMANQLRRDAPKKMWKLKNTRQTTETIGPRDGFEMRYTLRRNRVPFRTESGLAAVREVAELDRFIMVPVGSVQGELLVDALAPTSTFRSRISGWNPRETVITVWTYPDSFAEFRQLKTEMYNLGFLTAARPLPQDQLISGSPSGTRSAAQ